MVRTFCPARCAVCFLCKRTPMTLVSAEIPGALIVRMDMGNHPASALIRVSSC